MKTLTELQLEEQYGSRPLTNQEAMKELDLTVKSIARYLSPTHYNNTPLDEKLYEKYGYGQMSLDDMAFELSMSRREVEALLKLVKLEKSVRGVVYYIEEMEYFRTRLTKKLNLKKLYWEYKLTRDEIGNIVGMTHSQIQKRINKFGLGKKANGIKPKGKIGYKMPKKERAKHKMQKHSRAVLMIDPITNGVVKRFEVVEDAMREFPRSSVRRVLRGERELCRGFKFVFEEVGDE